jgi:hypothetical protein
MELVEILRILRSRWILLAIVTAVAVLAAAAVVVRGETDRGGAASAEVLVDARESTLGDLRHETLPLVARSSILARFLAAGAATETIASEAGLPANDLTVVGPPLTINAVPDAEGAERATERAEAAEYLVQVQQGDDLPLLTIVTEAPDEAQARALADGTVAALTDFVTDFQDDAAIPGKRRVTIRQLGDTRASAFVESPSPLLPAAAFTIVLALGCALILAWERIERRRSPDLAAVGELDYQPLVEVAERGGSTNGSEPEPSHEGAREA